jgi:galactokinase
MYPRIATYLRSLGQDPGDYDLSLRSPGRINIIGEHTDYNGGLVMPASIDHSIYFSSRSAKTEGDGAQVQAEWKLHAIDIDRQFTLPLPIRGRTGETWVDYLAGIGAQFQDRGHLLPPLEVVLGGDLPVGSGMSSSAALEGGMAFLLNALLNAGLPRPELAQICKRSSNTFLGIPSGIMDQFASLNGLASGPIVLNCATLDFEPVKNAIAEHVFILVNSMVSHDLSDGAYSRRVAECEAALAALRVNNPALPNLSAASMSELEAIRPDISSVVYRRASYVIAENERVRKAITALEAGNAAGVGQLLNDTHRGLRDDYEVSCPELDFLQTTATKHPAVRGSRMMGGGFGGCTLNLLRAGAEEAFAEAIKTAYQAGFGVEPEIYPVRLAGGTEILSRG